MYYITYRWTLSKLYRRKEKTQKKYDELIKEAQKTKKDEEIIRELKSEASSEHFIYYNAIASLMTDYLSDKAEKMFLPLPSFKEEEGLWEQNPMTGKKLLTKKGIAELNSTITKHRRERTETIFRWITLVGGLIGIITGLVAVWKN